MTTNKAKQQDEAALMQGLCRHIAAHCDAALKLDALAKMAGLSPSRFQRRFKAAIGVSPKEYHDACRLRLLKDGLKKEGKVTPAIYDAGFSSPSRVYGRAGKRLGMTPKQYAKDGADARISYAAAKTPLGRVMIGATDRGICFIQFANTQEELLALLRSEFPRAAIAPMPKASEKNFDAWMAGLRAFLAGDKKAPDLPLDIRGTAFQMKVWKYLQTIPAGETRSYKEVAGGIGAEKSARAVAKACASNRIALAIPCHRVIRGDGGLSGYKWGVERKEKLLSLEKIGKK